MGRALGDCVFIANLLDKKPRVCMFKVCMCEALKLEPEALRGEFLFLAKVIRRSNCKHVVDVSDIGKRGCRCLRRYEQPIVCRK